jgi:site-specific DNA recombinase
MTTVAIYARLSKEDSDARPGEKTGTERQLEDCRAHAVREGWNVVREYTDDGFSATNLRQKRPAFEAMLADLADGLRVDTVMTWKVDRLLRRPAEAERILDLAAGRGFGIYSLSDPSLDLSSPVGLFTFRLAVNLARLETDTSSRRIRRKAAELAKEGRPNSGIRMFGLRHVPGDRPGTGTLVVVPEEAALIREAADRILRGEALHAIVKDWKARGVRTPGTSTVPGGRVWEVSSLKRMLASPRIVGDRQHHGIVVGTGIIPPMLDRDVWTQLSAVLAVVKPGKGSSTPVTRHYLSGLVRCGYCGTKLDARLAQRGVYRYTCPPIRGCHRIVVAAKNVEPLVAEAIAQYLDGPVFKKALREATTRPASVAADAAQLAADQEALKALDEMFFIERTLPKDRHRVLTAKLTARIETVTQRLETATASTGLDRFAGLDIRAEWERRDVPWRHAVAKTLIEKVVVSPAPRRGTRFDPSRIAVVWR